MTARPHCQAPTACIAKGKGHCRRCAMSATARKLHADPEFAAANAERMRKLHAERRRFEIPAWVDCAGLRDDFMDLASRFGEEVAALLCRHLEQAARRVGA